MPAPLLPLLTRPFKENGPLTLCFFGDSITQGCFAYGEPPDYVAVYHEVLRRRLAAAYPQMPVNVLSAARRGDNLAMGLERIERDVLAHRPDVTFVCFGANDAWGDDPALFGRRLTEAIERITAVGSRVVLMTQHHMNKRLSPDVHPDLTEVARRMAERQNGGIVASFFAETRRVAAERDLPLCDVWARYDEMEKEGVDTDALLANRINHPTREVHRDIYAAMLFDLMTAPAL